MTLALRFTVFGPPARARRRWPRAVSAVGPLVWCLTFLFSGCTHLATPDQVSGNVTRHRFSFLDGGYTHYFELLRALPANVQKPETWMFVFPGSGCASMGQHLPSYFRGLDGESGPLRVFVLEKRHSVLGGRAKTCSDQFVRDDHPRRWLLDYREFVETQLETGHPRYIALVGISEGGEVVPRLATEIVRVTHVVLLASPGADPLDAFRQQMSKHGITGADEVLRAISGPPPADPSQAMLAGRSFRYWSELSELATRASLLQLRVPIFIGIGEADPMVPTELALETRDVVMRDGHASLTMLLFHYADHGLVDTRDGRGYLPDFWRSVDLWLVR